MNQIEAWDSRPTEEAFLFNPAFIGALIFEFVKAYQKERLDGTPLTFLPLSLSIILFQGSRERLPMSTITSLYEWVQRNEDLLVGFSTRTTNLVPYFKEGLRFSVLCETLSMGDGHLVVLGKNKSQFSAQFLRETTTEVKRIVDKTKFLARWFVKSGSEESILASWGIRP